MRCPSRRAVLAAVAAVPLAGCWRSRYEFNQKLTVTVATPRGDVSGSAVTNVITLLGQLPASASAVETWIKGEATVVAVAPGRYLFALIGEDTKALALSTEGRMTDFGTKAEVVARVAQAQAQAKAAADPGGPTPLMRARPA